MADYINVKEQPNGDGTMARKQVVVATERQLAGVCVECGSSDRVARSGVAKGVCDRCVSVRNTTCTKCNQPPGSDCVDPNGNSVVVHDIRVQLHSRAVWRKAFTRG